MVSLQMNDITNLFAKQDKSCRSNSINTLMREWVTNVNPYDSNSVSDCNGSIKPKSCIVEIFLIGPKDAGGSCPSPTHKYKNNCCCSHGCCWSACGHKSQATQSCLNGVPNSQWVFNNDKKTYQAVRNFKGEDKNYAFKTETQITSYHANQSTVLPRPMISLCSKKM